MDKPVGQHIKELENRISVLTLQLMDERKSQSQRNRTDAELRVAQQALEHYRKALELERQLQRR